MSTISSKQIKKHGLTDFVFVFLAVIIVLLVLLSSNVNFYNSFNTALPGLGSTHAGISTSRDVSFASDLRYWGANCSHGWSSDSTCDTIASKAQSCSVSADSVYCSEYDTYMQQFRN